MTDYIPAHGGISCSPEVGGDVTNPFSKDNAPCHAAGPCGNCSYVEVELEDFDTDDLIEELEKRGHSVGSAGELSDMSRIGHLLDCGLMADAKTEALLMIESQLGRPNTLSRAH